MIDQGYLENGPDLDRVTQWLISIKRLEAMIRMLVLAPGCQGSDPSLARANQAWDLVQGAGPHCAIKCLLCKLIIEVLPAYRMVGRIKLNKFYILWW